MYQRALTVHVQWATEHDLAFIALQGTELFSCEVVMCPRCGFGYRRRINVQGRTRCVFKLVRHMACPDPDHPAHGAFRDPAAGVPNIGFCVQEGLRALTSAGLP